jgi:hypothetical protein
MPIKRLKPASDEELITHIKNSLADHEEEYAIGAWESFNKEEQKRPTIVFWLGRLSIASAILLIGFAAFFYFKTSKPKINLSNDIVKNTPEVFKPAPIKGIGTNKLESNVTTKLFEETANNNLKSNPIAAATPDEVNIVEEFPEVISRSSMGIQQDAYRSETASVKQESAVSTPIITPDQSKSEIKKPITLDDFLAKENRLNKADEKKSGVSASDNKWDIGVMVAPSIGNNDKLNMGYGVSMAYNINNKLSIGSGLSYNEMGASKQVAGNSAPNSPSSNALINDTKSLQSINTQVSGLDIPLEVRYNLSRRFYANVGISALAVIKQQQNNVYLQGTVVQRSAVSPAGDVQSQSFLITEKVSEKAPETLFANSKLIGFYNFSFGYKQRLSKDRSIGIEPFVKVPMKEVAKENLRLLGTGLKIRFDF